MTIKILFLTIKLGNKIASFEKNYLEMQIRLYQMNMAQLHKEEVKAPYEVEITRVKSKIVGACEILGLRPEFSKTSSDVKIFQKNNMIIPK